MISGIMCGNGSRTCVIVSILILAFLILTSSVAMGTQEKTPTENILGQNTQRVPTLSPPNIIYEVPIIISNTQNIGTGVNFQEELVVNSSEFSSYESSNLLNVEFFYKNGSIIPSWLESGNSNNSTNTIYWLKLVNGIPADSSISIYIGFAEKNLNVFNVIRTGEAPQLSPLYGQYDDGANVFLNYWNFNGTSLPKGWNTLTTSQPVAAAYYDTNITRPFEVIDQPNGSRWVTGISTGYSQGGIGYAFVFYPGVSYWGDDGTSFGLYSYNSGPELLSTAGPASYPTQMGVGYDGRTVSSIMGYNFTSLNSSVVNFSSPNLIFVSSDTWGVGGGSAISVNNSLILSVSTGSNGQITTETNFIATAYFPPNGIMPATMVDGYVISFNETGLPHGKSWSIIIGNHTYNSSRESIFVDERPGNYSYNVVPGYGKFPSPSNGVVDVTDENVTVNVQFNFAQPVAEAPLTIVNNRSYPTGPYQQFLVINRSLYGNYINSNWSNVEFMYQNSSFVPAWIERPTENDSYATIVLKLSSIPRMSNLTIYMEFLPENISILSEYGPTGEGYNSSRGPYLSGQYMQYDNGNEVFPVYAIFDGPSFPSSWSMVGAAKFIPNVGVETVDGYGSEMGAVIFDGNLTGMNITVRADTYYSGDADQQNLGVYADDPSDSTGDNGGVGIQGYTVGFNPFYATAHVYYNGDSVSNTGFWNGGTAYFSSSISVNSTSLDWFAAQMTSNNKGIHYYLNYTAPIRKQGGLFFSSSTGGWNSVQFIYDLEVANTPPNNFMPYVVEGKVQGVSERFLERNGISFVGNYTSISVTTTAGGSLKNGSAQTLGQLISGVTNLGTSIITGLVYNWPLSDNKSSAGFNFLNTGLIATPGNSTYLKNSSYVFNLTWQVNFGDRVLVNMSIVNHTIILNLYNLNEHLGFTQSVSAPNVSYFVGSSLSPLNSDGYFTGVETCVYSSLNGNNGIPTVRYAFDSGIVLPSEWMWMDEYNGSKMLFAYQTSGAIRFNGSTPYFLYSNGTIDESNGTEFTTGILTSVEPITFKYSPISAGNNVLEPTLKFVFDSYIYTVPLSSAITTVYADTGSAWSVFPASFNVSHSERWSLETGSGTIAQGESINLEYYHQYIVTFTYSVTGGGSGFSPPSVSYIEFGTAQSADASEAGTEVWVDNGSSYQYIMELPGSGSDERWEASGGAINGIIDLSTHVDIAYTNQFYVQITNSASSSGLWYDNGSTIMLSLPQESGWKLMGWNITLLNKEDYDIGHYVTNKSSYSLTVSSALEATAILYTELTIEVTGGGSVYYTYGTVSGVVSGTQAIYTPEGTVVNLAVSNPIPFSFVGWFNGTTLLQSSYSYTIEMSSPISIHASFKTGVSSATTLEISIMVPLILIAFFFAVSIKKIIRP